MYEGLTEKGMRIWQFLEKGVREGLSFNQIIRIAREQKISYRRADMLHDLRIISKAVGKTDWQARAPSHRVVDEDFVIRTKNPTPKRFLVTFEVTFRDLLVEDIVTKYITVGSDEYHSLSWYKKKLIVGIYREDYLSMYNNELLSARWVKAVGWW